MQKTFHVYILTNKKDGVLYIGVTSDLVQRIHQHKTNAVEGFTSNYNLHHLVYFEEHATAEAAITREKKLKNWHHPWKVALIEGANPEWRDLYEGIVA